MESSIYGSNFGEVVFPELSVCMVGHIGDKLMDGGPFGIYSTSRPGRWNTIKTIALLALVAIITIGVYAYNHGPGRNSISADVDQYGRSRSK
jgi:hypothetical protein